MKLYNALLKILVLFMVLSILYAAGKVIVNRVAWGLADHITKGAIRAEKAIALSKLKNFGQYEKHLDIMLDKIQTMSWEEFRVEEARRLGLEKQMAQAAGRIIDSYLEYSKSRE